VDYEYILMLEQYFTPVSLSQEYAPHNIGSVIQKYDTNFPELTSGKTALLTVVEELGQYDAVRAALYSLVAHTGLSNKLIDLGDMLTGETPADTYAAIQYVSKTLRAEGITTIVLGTDTNQGEAMYKSFDGEQKQIEATLISSHLPLLEYELLNRICSLEPNYLGQLNVLGFQAHYIPLKAMDMLENLNFGHQRLGQLKNRIEDSELYLRNSDLVLFNLNAMKHMEAPAQNAIQPNGLNSDEACQLARYSGMSDANTAFGIFGFLNSKNDSLLTSELIAQIIWYYIDGVLGRMNDTPASHSEFIKYRCDFSENEDTPLLFLKSKRTARWWMQVEHPGYPENNKMDLIIPCSYEDYVEAANGEMPARYFRAIKRV
jgi:formiminoglutamase